MKYILTEGVILTEASDFNREWSDLNLNYKADKTKANNNDELKKLDAKYKKQMDEFWNKFFQEMFPGKADQAKTYLPAIKLETQEYGFANSNPFIKFLNTLFGLGIIPTLGGYGAIHNAVARGLLTTKNLVNDKASNDFASVIFSPSLYRQTPGDILVYLKLCSDIKYNADKLVDAQADENSQKYKTLGAAIDDIMFENGKIDGNLKPLTAIRQLIKEKGAVTSAEVDSSKLNAVFKDGLSDEDKLALSMLFAFQWPNKENAILKLLADRKITVPNDLVIHRNKLTKYTKALADNKVAITEDNVIAAVQEILKVKTKAA